MPGAPPTTPYLAIPRYAAADPAEFPAQANAISDMVDDKLGHRAWVTPAYGFEPIEAISWTGTGQYCRVGQLVLLRGVMDIGGSSQPMPPWFTLPAGFRPSQEMRFATWSGGIANVDLVIVEPDGDVRGAANAGARLDGVTFRIA